MTNVQATYTNAAGAPSIGAIHITPLITQPHDQTIITENTVQATLQNGGIDLEILDSNSPLWEQPQPYTIEERIAGTPTRTYNVYISGTSVDLADLSPIEDPDVLTVLGPTGPQGPTGPTGPGITGPTGPGITGPIGPGITGPTGPTGQLSQAQADARYASISTIGNLLTDNQASGGDALGSTAGFSAQLGTVAYTGGEVVCTSTTAGATYVLQTTGGVGATPVLPSTVYTAVATVRQPTGTRTIQVLVAWYTAAGTFISSSASAGLLLTGTATERWLTATSPATAAFAAIYVQSSSAGSVGDTVALQSAGLWKGAGGEWAMPGTPITGTQQPWETVETLAQLPATQNWLGRKIRVAQGLGLQIMVWNGTAWVVAPESDTGWQTIALDDPALFQTYGRNAMRRVGGSVTWQIRATAGTGTITGTRTIISKTMPTGWRAMDFVYRGLWARFNDYAPLVLNNATAGARLDMFTQASSAVWASSYQLVFDYTYPTTDAWPTTAP